MTYLVVTLGWVTVIAHLTTALAGFSCLTKMRSEADFSNTTLYSSLYDALRMLCPCTTAEYKQDGRGWAAIYFGVALASLTSLVFAGVHASFMINELYIDIGQYTAAEWFMAHIFRCVGTIALIYGAAHGAKQYIT